MKLVKIGLFSGALLAGVLFIGLAVQRWQTQSRQTALDKEWRQTTGVTTPELLGGFPRQEKNEAAKRLEELAARLLKVVGETSIKDVFESDFDRFAGRQIGESSDSPELSENLKTFLAAHQSDFEALYDCIEQNPAPQWELNLEQPAFEAAPSPSPFDFAFLSNLHSLIALDVLDKTRRNNSEAALRAFAASWKATAFLRERPELSAQTMNFIIAETQLAVLRQMNRVSREWEQRILATHYHSFGLKVLQLEYSAPHSAAFVPASDFLRGQNKTGVAHFLATSVLPVFEENQRLDFSAAGIKTVAYLQQTDFCSFDREFRALDQTSPGGILFRRPLRINFVEKWQNYAELAYDLELTSQVLRAKRLANRSSSESTAEQSNLCKDSQWTIAQSPDRSIVIRFSRAAELLNNNETPLTYTIKARE